MIQIPISYIVKPSGATTRLLSEQESERLKARAETARAEGQVRQAEALEKAIAADTALREGADVRSFTLSFRDPSYRDDIALKGLALREMRSYCRETGIEPCDELYDAFLMATRPQVLCTGDWEAVPESLRGEVSELLAILVRLDPEDRRFLSPSPAGPPETGAPLPQ